MTITTEQSAALRRRFPASQVQHRPEFTCRLCRGSDNRRCAQHGWITNCEICRTSHTDAVEHVPYVGHAHVTERLNKVVPGWSWEPYARDEHGLPVLDRDGVLWIRFTVEGVTIVEVGDGSTAKDRIANAIRRGAMRFGVGTYLWAEAKHIEATIPRPEPAADARPPRRRVSEVVTAAPVLSTSTTPEKTASEDGAS